MKTIVQRVAEAAVLVDGREVAAIGPGLLALVGIQADDTDTDRDWTARKLAHLRIFPDGQGLMNRSVLEGTADVLLVPNFTVAGGCRKGRRPSFDGAMRPPEAQERFAALADAVAREGARVSTGVFGAQMQVRLNNDGPVTLILDSRAV